MTGCDDDQLMTSHAKSTKADVVKIPALHKPCDVIKMAKFPKKEVEAYNMIKIEFNELANEELLNAASIAEYVGVEFKSKNSQLLIYQEWLSLIFFVINVVNTIFWYYKLSKIESSEMGTVRRLISLGLLIMMLFNAPYRLFFEQQ